MLCESLSTDLYTSRAVGGWKNKEKRTKIVVLLYISIPKGQLRRHWDAF